MEYAGIVPHRCSSALDSVLPVWSKKVDGTDKRVLPNSFMVYLGMNLIEHEILTAHNNLITEKEVFVALKHSGCCIYPANKI